MQPCRGTSLLRNNPPVGPCSRPMPEVLGGWVLGGWAFSYGRGTPVVQDEPALGRQVGHVLSHVSSTLSQSVLEKRNRIPVSRVPKVNFSQGQFISRLQVKMTLTAVGCMAAKWCKAGPLWTISMLKWIRTRRLSIKNSLSDLDGGRLHGAEVGRDGVPHLKPFSNHGR